MEEKSYVKCPVCGQYTATIEKEQDFESRICESCGFTTNNQLKTNSEFIPIFESQQTQLVKECRFEDDNLDQYWYPITVHVEGKGALYPEGKPGNLNWKFAPVVPIAIMERIMYPIEGKEGYYHETRLAPDMAVECGNFSEAYNKFKSVK